MPSLIEGLRIVQGLRVVPVFLYQYSMKNESEKGSWSRDYGGGQIRLSTKGSWLNFCGSGFRFGIQSVFRISGSGFLDLGSIMLGVGYRIQDSGVGVNGLRFRIQDHEYNNVNWTMS